MKTILFLLLFSTSVIAETYLMLEANIGLEISGPWNNYDTWQGEIPTEFKATIYHHLDGNLYTTGGYSHTSNLLTGPPFNDNPETVLDRVFVGIGYRFDL